MKRSLFSVSFRFVATSVALVLAIVTAAAPLAASSSLGLGAKAPSADVAMKNVDDTNWTIAKAAGAKGTLVVFTCNHCPYAKAWEERIVALGNGYSKKGVGVIAINSNDPSVYEDDAFEPMKGRAKKRGMTFPYVVDATSDVARAFGATKTPEAFLFDAAGKLVYHGTIDDNAEEASQVSKHFLKDALEAVAAGKTPSVQETKSVGCSIKFRKK